MVRRLTTSEAIKWYTQSRGGGRNRSSICRWDALRQPKRHACGRGNGTKLDRDGGAQRSRSLTVPAWGHVLYRKGCSARFSRAQLHGTNLPLNSVMRLHNIISASCLPRDRAASRITTLRYHGSKRPRSKAWRQLAQRSGNLRAPG